MQDRQQYNILYSCTGEPKHGHEPFVAQHALTFVVSGELHFHTPYGIKSATKGCLGFVRKNQLVKPVKLPEVDKPFMSISILFDNAALQAYSMESNIRATGVYTGESILELPVDPFMKGYLDSLVPYFEYPEQMTGILARAKTTEAIELLLRDAGMKNILFDFSEPFKIDLEAYMNKYFIYNVPISQFARLTGRSLSAFKRDFAKIFNTSPEKWLQKRRLEQAHYLITQKGTRPSEVYLEVGFENLSHFSYAFKKQFGVAPSGVV